MARYRHEFVEEYDGLMGMGFGREVDEATFTCYCQTFADDDLMKIMRERMSSEELESFVDSLMGLMRRHLSGGEYHRYFLKDED